MTFKHGRSGNPDGRPKGSGFRQQLFKTLVEPHKEALFDTAIKLALEGNEAMMRLLLERMLPAKPTDDAIHLEMPESNTRRVDALLAYGSKVLSAVSEGELSPQQAKILMGSLEIQRKNIETAELTDRVIAIEKILKQRK